MGSRAESNVIINAHRKRVRFLEHHAHAFAEHVNIVIQINIIAVKQNFACYTAAFNQIVHTVQAAQQGGFAAAGRPDECSDFFFTDMHVDILQCVKFAVI